MTGPRRIRSAACVLLVWLACGCQGTEDDPADSGKGKPRDARAVDQALVDGRPQGDAKAPPPGDSKLPPPKDGKLPPPKDGKLPPPQDSKPPPPDQATAKPPTLADLFAGKAKWAVDQASVPVKGGPGHREAFAVNRADISPTTIYLYHRCFAPKGKTSICLSVSSDGGSTFAKYHGVIVAPDTGHTFSVAPAVAKMGSTWLMVYEESHVSNVYWAQSSDGIKWTKKGKLLSHGSKGKWDSGAIATPGILVDGVTVYVFYAGFPTGGKKMSIGYAWGFSMGLMLKAWGNPMFKPPASGWDAGQHSMGRVVKEGTKFYMVYEGASQDFTCNKSNRYGWGMARSTNLKQWTPHGKNPFGLSSQKKFGCGNDMPSIFRRYDGRYFVYHTSADTSAIVREKLVWNKGSMP